MLLRLTRDFFFIDIIILQKSLKRRQFRHFTHRQNDGTIFIQLADLLKGDMFFHERCGFKKVLHCVSLD